MNKWDREGAMYQETIDAYNEWLSNDESDIYLSANDTDVLIAGYSNSAIEQNRFSLGVNFKLHEDEIILWARDTSFWNDKNQGCVITDWGVSVISDNDNPENILQWEWNSIERVEYKNQCFYLYDINNESSYFHISYVFKDEDDYVLGYVVCQLFNSLAQSQQGDTVDKVRNRIKELYDGDKLPEALQECDYLLNNVDDDDNKFFGLNYKQAIAYDIAKSYQSAENSTDAEIEEIKQKRKVYTDIALECLNDLQQINPLPWIYLRKAIVLDDPVYGIPEYQEARRMAIAALKTDDANDKKSAIQVFKDIDNEVLGYFNSFEKPNLSREDLELYDTFKFTNIPFTERQFIMFAKNADKIQGYYDPTDELKWIFTLDNLPKDLYISGYPQANVLYLANPVKPNEYIPFENAEDEIFMDKVREYCRLVQCLGATEISFRYIKGNRFSEDSMSSLNGGAKVDGLLHGVGAEAGYRNHDYSQSEFNQRTEITQTFSPERMPYCPGDLVWLNHEPKWKNLIKQRMENGGINSDHYKISTSETCQLSNQKVLDIKASFESIMVDVNANFKKETDTTFKNHKETEWEISVKFMPLNELRKVAESHSNTANIVSTPIPQNTNTSSSSLTADEKEYLEEVKVYLADGEISANDRECLEDLRKDFGISVERAKELEASLAPSLNENEQKYFDFVFKRLDDGIIDEKERGFLDRRRESLGISDSRAKEIEDMAFAKRGLK